MKLLIDGVCFRVRDTSIARLWRSLIACMVAQNGLEIYVLDRGGRVPAIEGIRYIPFPTISSDQQAKYAHSADESALIQKICDSFEIDVFASTFYTTPLSTPTVMIVYDMIPELFGVDLSERVWMEKDASICFAQRYICISETTRSDLLAFYPEIPMPSVSVSYCGVDHGVFAQRSPQEVTKFRDDRGWHRPYYLFVGSRAQQKDYKNSLLFFRAIAGLGTADFDVRCVGGEAEIEGEIAGTMPEGVQCTGGVLTDVELALAYNGALALVHPPLYGGFGMPVLEAMACGCPVITTKIGSLAELVGNATCIVSGHSVPEMQNALRRIRDNDYHDELRRAGLLHASNFKWQYMADQFAESVLSLHATAKTGAFDFFFQEWQRVRKIQASVDF